MRSTIRRAVVVAATAGSIWALGGAAADAATPSAPAADLVGTVAGPVAGTVHGVTGTVAGATGTIGGAAGTLDGTVGKVTDTVNAATGAVGGTVHTVRSLAAGGQTMRPQHDRLHRPGGVTAAVSELTDTAQGTLGALSADPSEALPIALGTANGLAGNVGAGAVTSAVTGVADGLGAGVPALPAVPGNAGDLANGMLGAGTRLGGLGRFTDGLKPLCLLTAGFPSVPALPAVPTLPTLPSLPAVPSVPALPSLPGVPAVPSVPVVTVAVVQLTPVVAVPEGGVRSVLATGTATSGGLRHAVTVVRTDLPAVPTALPARAVLPTV
jgi:hypothetical protein